ncbi:M14 family zinc carboxypeptidase [Olleya aquimaris]|uniref:Putative secreted protein (Por secretion system target) n=1 Tax=Olleya aquimaris TaxID=639310 RepID=A0A327RJE9_9FLAO|nr:M14 family zinc carboxypeptidase [Olleya aquimaris]RAJ17049.1 putative secreted protein (Por secretion system target) [Olleya aquimaris]
MKKITLLIILALTCTFTFSQVQEKISKISITHPDEGTLRVMASQGLDLSCGAAHDEHGDLTLELTSQEINVLNSNNIQYKVLVDDLTKDYLERSRKEKATRNTTNRQQAQTNTVNQARASVSSVIQDNIIQHYGPNEINWVQPTNFQLGTNMGNCLTISEVLAELDAMNAADTNNIVSARQDASSTGQKTWGNPANTTPNPLYPYTAPASNGMPEFSEPENYIGQGTSRWDPQTINYVRITGNESSTPEGTKPQILYTSMIHSREVSALMNNIYFMWYLIENYGTDPGVTELVDNNELYFVPVVNPDGLRWNEHLSPGGNGSQRKNCRPNTGSTSNSTSLRGVDLNRNFDYFWNYNNIGSSGSPTSNTYRGPYAASEPETQIMVDFITNRNFKTAVWNHSYANSVPHPYGGIPTQASNREDEFYRWHEEMTRYNRYLYGATIFYESNGLPDDWMAGSYDDGVNPPVPDDNGSLGSGQGILGTTPEHGSSGQGFWPSDAAVYLHAERSMRISFATAYYGGKYAKLHDLTQSNINGTTANIDFGIERIGQTPSNFTVTVTPISTNITGVTQAGTETGMSALEQRTVTAQLQLANGIPANEKIEYNVKLSNDNGIIYEANFEKYYNPTLMFDHNPDINGISGWTQSGGWNNSSVDAYSGTNALRTGNTVPYATNSTKTLTTTNSYDFTNSDEVIIQFYTKWDLERNYDYVEVLASKDGTNWLPLSGKYTKPEATSSTTSHDNKSTGSTFQSGSSGQVYDGDRMDNWVMEEFVINAGTNSTFLQTDATNVQFRFNFRSDASDVSENYSTTSDGFFIDDFKIISLQIPCVTDVPTNVTVSAIGASEATVSWDAIPSATYDLRYRETGTSTWLTVPDITSASFTIINLMAQTQYDVQVRSKCDTATSAYSATVNFTTSQITYCASQGTNINDEYIGRVQLNDLDNDTSSSTTSGYSDFTSMVVDLTKNTTPTITVTKIWTGTLYNEGVAVWIDFNQDGDFEDAGEQVVSSNPSQNVVSENITIPLSALTGLTRMRVSMKYNAVPTSCETFTYGEVEDYTVNIKEQTLSIQENTLDNLNIYPNPFKESINIKLPNQISSYNIELFDISGRVIYNSKKLNVSTNTININNLGSLSNGTYLLKITDLDKNKSIIKKLIK